MRGSAGEGRINTAYPMLSYYYCVSQIPIGRICCQKDNYVMEGMVSISSLLKFTKGGCTGTGLTAVCDNCNINTDTTDSEKHYPVRNDLPGMCHPTIPLPSTSISRTNAAVDRTNLHTPPGSQRKREERWLPLVGRGIVPEGIREDRGIASEIAGARATVAQPSQRTALSMDLRFSLWWLATLTRTMNASSGTPTSDRFNEGSGPGRERGTTVPR